MNDITREQTSKLKLVMIENKIFRYEFDNNIKESLDYFSKLHSNEDRKTFKENFEKWFIENSDELLNEKRRIENLGYSGDIKEKLYVALRYYYLKKNKKQIQTPITKRSEKYVKINTSLLYDIDNYIKNEMEINHNFKPQNIFETFCESENNKDLLKTIITEFKNNNITTADEIEKRIKKIFKNRIYYLSSNRINNNDKDKDNDNNKDKNNNK